MESTKLKLYQNRLIVADLIEAVLTDRITVSQALSNFPHERSDINLKCAFDALVHRESDENLRMKISDYAQVQDEFLMQIAQILKQNEPLPQNIVNQYLKYHHDNLISDFDNSLKNILKKIKRMINF